MSVENDRKWMELALAEAQKSPPEPTKRSPLVGAIVIRNGELVSKAYRSETNVGDHAEFVLLEHKLKDEDVSDCIVYTTLEPCSERNPNKTACAKRLIDRRIREVVVGMLDPDPRIYSHGCQMLKSAGVNVRYFAEDIRVKIRELNSEFIDRFRPIPNLAVKCRLTILEIIQFSIGHGNLLFQTRWSKRSNTSIYAYTDGTSCTIAMAAQASEFSDVLDPSIYDFSSRTQTVQEGEILAVRNPNNFFALVKVIDVFDRSRPPDKSDRLVFRYKILTNE